MSQRDREQYAKRRQAVLAAKKARWRATHPIRTGLCAACQGRSVVEWCRACRSRHCHRRNQTLPDYVARANRVIARRVGRSWREFTPDDQHEVTLLLVKWAQERGQLLDYDPNRKPLDVKDWKRSA